MNRSSVSVDFGNGSRFRLIISYEIGKCRPYIPLRCGTMASLPFLSIEGPMPFLRNSVLPLSGYILAHLTVLVNRKFAKNDGFLTKIAISELLNNWAIF